VLGSTPAAVGRTVRFTAAHSAELLARSFADVIRRPWMPAFAVGSISCYPRFSPSRSITSATPSQHRRVFPALPLRLPPTGWAHLLRGPLHEGMAARAMRTGLWSHSGGAVQILSLGNEFKMVRPDAQPIAAQMVDHRSLGRLTDQEMMRHYQPPVDTELAVTQSVLVSATSSCARPQPARLGAVHLRPETFLHRRLSHLLGGEALRVLERAVRASDVLRLGDQLKVFWVHTVAHPANVVPHASGRRRADQEVVRHHSSVVLPTAGECPVPVRLSCTRPQPARLGLLDFRPEPGLCGDRLRSSFHNSSIAA
jgi:hypothetical protein